MAEEQRMIPPQGQESVPVFIPSGQSVRVYRTHPEDGKEGSVVPTKFKKEAFKLGCVFVGEEYDEDDGMKPAQSQEELIVAAIRAILHRDDPDEIEADGRPKLATVKDEAGFGVTRAQLTSAWAVFEKSLG